LQLLTLYASCVGEQLAGRLRVALGGLILADALDQRSLLLVAARGIAQLGLIAEHFGARQTRL